MRQPPPELVARLRAARFLAIDPGTKHPAAAVYDRGKLVAASRVRLPASVAGMTKPLQQSERSRLTAGYIINWMLGMPYGALGYAPPVAVVHEWPQIYRSHKSKGDPNKLIPLAAIGTAVAARLDVEAVSVEPDEWIGNVPKDDELPPELSWESPRGKFIKGRLEPDEITRVVLSHDAVDAAGIGAWALGRLAPRYV